MKTEISFKKIPFIILVLMFSVVHGQIPAGVYMANSENIQHELKINKGYLTHTVYKTNPAEFIKTLGGFYTANDHTLKINLEFNSDFEKDGVKTLEIPFTLKDEGLTLMLDNKILFKKTNSMGQDLDGQWLFATRGPDTGQERRGDENPRKTLKFLMDGRFQWIAYQTETMNFSGTGGGSFILKDGVYTENIEFFSRDNNRVGASLEFNYELKEADWHHTGKNSKGEPMYEIWAKRN